MDAFLLSTAVIFVAELGDKSQLMAMTFAARYTVREVLLAITGATLVVHLASVAIGALVGNAFADTQWIISIIAGLAFLVFAAWTLRGDSLTADEEEKARRSTGAALVAVGTAFGWGRCSAASCPSGSSRSVRPSRSWCSASCSSSRASPAGRSLTSR